MREGIDPQRSRTAGLRDPRGGTAPRDASTDDRRTPYSFNRAATAVVQCRKMLERAGDETREAMMSLADLQDEDIGLGMDPMELIVRLRRLGEILVLLERSQRALATAWPVTRDPVDASTTGVP
jgi:hypothetical protein